MYWGNGDTNLVADHLGRLTMYTRNCIGDLRGTRACWAWGVSFMKNFGRKSFPRLSLEVGETCGQGPGKGVVHLSATWVSGSEAEALMCVP